MVNKVMKFSVLMPVYNGDKPKLFDMALTSIKNNSVQPTQIVVVVDGEISSSLEKTLAAHSNNSFDIIRIEQNQGIVNALNTGLDFCSEELVARCDADDENYEKRFELQLKAFENEPDLSVVGGHIIERGNHGEHHRNVPITREGFTKHIKLRNPLNHMTVMFKRSDVLAVGKYPDIKYREDYALWGKLHGYGYRLKNLNKVLVFATGGMDMYKRRGKPSDIPYEWKLQKYLLSCNVIKPHEMAFNLFIRISNMLVGPNFRSLIYSKFLRKTLKES